MGLENIYKLVTNEDRFHIHKTMGVACLVNFFYRYFLLLTTGSMNLATGEGIGFICLHGLLSASSLIFHLPDNRISGKPMIYPEMRLHTIIFTMRSVLCCLSYFLELHQTFRFFLIMATMFSADMVTEHYKLKNYGTTIRNMPYDARVTEEAKESVRLMNSQMQIGATLFMLGGSESAFFPMFAIQFASLLSTLVRKSIISANMWHILYAISLWMNIALYTTLPMRYIVIQSFTYIIYTEIFFVKRTNKYMNWSIIFTLFSLYEYVPFSFSFDGYESYEKYCRGAMIIAFIAAQVYKTRGLFLLG